MAIEGSLVNPEVLQSLYGHVPALDRVRVRSINLNRCGPTVTLRVDLPSFPDLAPPEWLDAGTDTVQCQFQFLAATDITLTAWSPPALAGLRMRSLGRERRMRVSVHGRGIDCGFECGECVTAGHVSAFKAGANGSDSGEHFFVGKVDARLHTSLPATDEKTFYER
ncbi:Imm50 family immunity protein [Streptomyces sp. NPDC047017]|uniref:Imm50 family immunity protein n=1 Tax=Streptomyces sp. NPDC047017 TaxID=3155024 RepID=UPI0033D4B379